MVSQIASNLARGSTGAYNFVATQGQRAVNELREQEAQALAFTEEQQDNKLRVAYRVKYMTNEKGLLEAGEVLAKKA